MHDLDRTLAELNEEADINPLSNEDGMLSEAEESALAAELLSVNSEDELDQFFKKLMPKLRKSMRGPLGGLLKGVARQGLSSLGNAIAPGIGGAVASGLGRSFGLEAEGSGSEEEWETAKRIVRLSRVAANKAARIPASVPPVAAAKAAVASAAGTYGSGDESGDMAPVPGTSGTWVRRNNKIILFGV